MKHHFPKDLYTQIRPSSSHLKILGGVFCAAILLGCLSLPFWPRVHRATVTLAIRPEKPDALSEARMTGLQFDSRSFLNTQASIINSQIFLTRVAGELGLAKRWDQSNRRVCSILKNSIGVKTRFSEREIEITYSSPNSAEAVEIANAVGNSFLQHWRNNYNDRYAEMIDGLAGDHQEFKSAVAIKLAALHVMETGNVSSDELQKTKAELADLKVKNALFESRISKIKYEQNVVSSAARITRNAASDRLSFGPRIGAGIMLMVMMALLATSATATFLFLKSRRRVSITDIARSVSPHTLALFPKTIHGEKGFVDPAHSRESFEVLRDRILELCPNPEGVTIAMVPCLLSDDASTIASELAKLLAEGGHPTLLIEGNLKAPRVHGYFDASPHPGVSEFLTGELSMCETVVKTSFNRLWMMPGGTVCENTAQLLVNEKMKELIAEARSRFDFVIFNGAPMMSAIDSLILISESDLTFLCADAGKATREMLIKTRHAVDQSGGKIGGLILTGVEPDEARKKVDFDAELAKG